MYLHSNADMIHNYFHVDNLTATFCFFFRNVKCLLDTTSANMLSRFSMKLEHFAVRKQCELAFGSKVIRDFSEKFTMEKVRESVFRSFKS